jgi:hypothetical protein
MTGLSTIGSISFGCTFVAGRKRVPNPAAGITAFLIIVAFSSEDVGAIADHLRPEHRRRINVAIRCKFFPRADHQVPLTASAASSTSGSTIKKAL